MMSPQSDGRTISCSYCGGQIQVAIDSAQIAAGLQLDLGNIDAFLARLATTLHGNFASRVKLRQDGAQLTHFEINLDPDLFVAKRNFDAMVLQHKKLVRGVALKTVTHPIDQWIAMLTDSLAKHANTRADAARAIAQLKIR
jgi:hypothetical protein